MPISLSSSPLRLWRRTTTLRLELAESLYLPKSRLVRRLYSTRLPSDDLRSPPRSNRPRLRRALHLTLRAPPCIRKSPFHASDQRSPPHVRLSLPHLRTAGRRMRNSAAAVWVDRPCAAERVLAHASALGIAAIPPGRFFRWVYIIQDPYKGPQRACTGSSDSGRRQVSAAQSFTTPSLVHPARPPCTLPPAHSLRSSSPPSLRRRRSSSAAPR